MGRKYLLTTLIFLLFSVYSQYVEAPTIISNNSQCYMIYNQYDKQYKCLEFLNAPCYYDIIISNSKNIVLTCDFDKILVYNSSNITIRGSGYVYSLDSNINCFYKENTVYNDNYYTTLICVPPDVNVIIRANKLIRGVLGYIKIVIYSKNTYKNVLLILKSSCVSKIAALNASIPAVIRENSVLFPVLPANESITIYYGIVPISARSCQLVVEVKANYQNVVSLSENTQITNQNLHTINKLKLSESNILLFFFKYLIKLFYL